MEKVRIQLTEEGVPSLATLEIQRQILDEDIVDSKEIEVPVDENGNPYFETTEDESDDEDEDDE